jgi:cellulose synthase/poly-beta-1,6-N-acetylglucosamine synthase-like glycosyltransferase
MLIFKLLFWIALFPVFWTYIGYFIFLKAMSLGFSKKVGKRNDYPPISIIIAAYNEENRIKQKIENTLSVNYPKERREIIVVSDGSTDATPEIAKSYESQGVRVSSYSVRRGKHYCQGEGIQIAQNDIVVLSDATTFLMPDSLEKIISNFADPTIGCVSGHDKIQAVDGSSSGEGAYVKYEMKVRELESRVGSLVGVSGSFFAIRKKLCQPWYPDMSSDFYLPLLCRIKGYRSILDSEAIGYYSVLSNQKAEFRRKVRTVVHGIDALFKIRKVANPFRYGFFSIQVISHKLFRWLVPFCLILIFISNLFVLNQGAFFKTLFLMQSLFYGVALLGLIVKNLKELIIFRIPSFFVMANFSILVAWFKLMTGERYVTWDSTKR